MKIVLSLSKKLVLSLSKGAFLFVLGYIYTPQAQAQTLPQRAEQRAKDKVGNKSDETVDKSIDSAFSKTGHAIGNLFKKKDKKKKTEDPQTQNSNVNTTAQTNNGQVTGASTGGSAVKVNSAGDFVPGDKILFEDHFEKDPEGDFPAQWNTNGSGKIVTIDGVPGKWLSIVHNSIVNPVMDKALPENCTIEFDLFMQADGQHTTPFIQFGLTQVRDILKEDMAYKDRFFMNIHRYSEEDGKTVEFGLKNDVVGSKSDFPITSYVNKVLHVSIAVNKTRVRIYLGDTKLIDLPRALTPVMRNNFFLNNNYIIPASELGMLVGNVRIASSEVDARSLLIKQLMEEGKAVTSDILFDVNSDVIKPQSYEIIDQFGDAMVKNPSLRIRITGHTDNDGTDAANLALSQKRAASVKKYILGHYKTVDASRLETDGKGESQPVAPNTTAEGKAKNRRVEFVKL